MTEPPILPKAKTSTSASISSAGNVPRLGSCLLVGQLRSPTPLLPPLPGSRVQIPLLLLINSQSDVYLEQVPQG